MAHPIYERFHYKYRLQLESIARSHFKPEKKEWQMYITSLAKYAETVNQGYCDLHINKNYVCMVHLIRMMCDACFEAYRLLLVNDKEGYLKKYLFNEGKKELNKFRVANDQATSTLIKNKIVDEYGEAMAKVYEYSNRFIHPSNFYYRDYSLEDRREIIHNPDTLLDDYSRLFDKDEVARIDDIMDVLNEVLLDILDKLKEYVEPTPQLPNKIDLATRSIIHNTDYKEEDGVDTTP